MSHELNTRSSGTDPTRARVGGSGGGRRPASILRFAGAVVLAHLIGVLVIGWVVSERIGRAQRDMVVDRLASLASVMESRYEEALRAGDADALRRLAARDAERAGVVVAVTGAGGRVLAHSHLDAARMTQPLARPEIDEAMRVGEGRAFRDSDILHANVASYSKRLGEEHEGSGAALTLTMRFSGAPTALQREVMLTVWAIGGGLALVLAGILLAGWRRVRRGSMRLAEDVHRLREAGLRGRVSEPEAWELAPVAEALDDLCETLIAQMDHLRIRHNEARAIVRSMPGAVLALDTQQRILSVNKTAELMLGIEGAVVRGRLLQEAMRQSELNRFLAEAEEDPGPAGDEFDLDLDSDSSEGEYIARGLGRIRVQATRHPLQDPTGKPIGQVVVLHDVTRLRRLETMRRDFAANVSHELRTPITNIKGYLETLLEVGVEDRDRAMQFLEVIHRNADRLAAIVEDMLALTRLEQGGARDSIEIEDAPVAALVASVRRQFEDAAAAKQIEIHEEAPDDLVAQVNARLIEQALSNLVSNAIKYSPSGTAVTIRARRVGAGEREELELGVIDQGPGIERKHLARVFERFYRVDKARSRELGGTGLGLAIVKHIALLHGGRVAVDSVVGRGSAFKIIVPLTGARTSPEGLETGAEPESANPPRIS